MVRWLVIILITILILLLTYFSDEQRNFKRAVKRTTLFGGIATALGFCGPYIVELFESPQQKVQKSVETKEYTSDYIIQENSTSNDDEESETSEDANESSESSGSSDIEYITFISETHDPSDFATNVGVSGWNIDEDFDIAGQSYDGGVKITIYNMFSALDGNSSSISNQITSEIHYALNTSEIEKLPKEEQRFAGKFVVGKETNGSPSTAVISILVDGEEKYNSGEINCYSLDIPHFNIELTGKREMIIRTVCQHKGNPLIIGMVDNG